MQNRRAIFRLASAAAATVMMRRTGRAQSADARQDSLTPQTNSLQDRGAPTGRIGAATRGARSDDGGLTVDLVAPSHGVGLTSVAQPELCFLQSGRAAQPFQLAISIPGLARPLGTFELPRVRSQGLGIVRLRDHGIHLPPHRLCVWSLTLTLDPRAPSQDLVCSALIEYQPNSSAFEAANREPSLASRVTMLARAGYWYDAVTLAERDQAVDQGAGLASLFRQADLPIAGSPGPAR